MRYTPKNKDGLLVCLQREPDDRKVDADPDTGIKASTVKDLRALSLWPRGLALETPREGYLDQTVKITKAN